MFHEGDKTVQMEAGAKYGRLEIVEQSDDWKIYFDKQGVRHRIAMWKCRCVCGKLVTVPGRALRSGNTTSCRFCRKSDTKKKQYAECVRIGGLERNEFGQIIKFDLGDYVKRTQQEVGATA